MKIGRNDPCPCNSGKKYKRCCLENDAKLTSNTQSVRETVAKSKNRAEELSFPDDDFINIELSGEIEYCTSWVIEGHGDILPELVKMYRENTSKEFYSIYENNDDEHAEMKDLSDTASKNELPMEDYDFDEDDLIAAISPKDEALVDKWWEDSRVINDPVAELDNIKKFLVLYPHLDVNMSLQDEVMFDLQRKFELREDYPRFIDFLIYYRENHPKAYTLSFGYYDNYLITYLLVQNKSNEEIAPYFSFFKKYPLKFIDNFMEVAYMIISFGREDLLENLYQDICTPFNRAETLLNQSSIIELYLLLKWTPFIKKITNSTVTLSEIVDAIDEQQIHFNSQFKNRRILTGKKRLTRLIDEYFGELPRLVFPHPFNYVETKKYYRRIVNSYAGYQAKSLSRPWVLSHNISNSIFEFLIYPLERNKIPLYPFKFSKELIYAFAKSKYRSFFSDNICEEFCFLYGLVDFCNFLKQAELISVDEFEQLHAAARYVLDIFCEKNDRYVMTYYRKLVINRI